jgi:sec-independent protein translocase protein TatC
VSLIGKFKAFRGNGKNKAGKPSAEMSFLDHVEELRWHIIRSLIAIGIVGVFAFSNVQLLLDKVILAPFSPEFPMHKFLCGLQKSLCFDRIDVDFIAIDPYEQFLKAFGIAFIGGFIIAFPYIAWEFWRFIKPGLHPKEQKKLRGNVLIISFLFFTGIVFAYYVITPFSVSFLSNFKLSEAVQNQWKIGKVISLVTQIVIAGGLLFELPIVVYYLSRLGLISPEFMKSYRKHAMVILLIVAAIITPPDVLSQILIMIPLGILYEVSVRICVVVSRKREKELAGDPPAANPPATGA